MWMARCHEEPLQRCQLSFAAMHLPYCNLEIIKQRGLDNVTAEDLVQELTPKGRAEVPSAVKVHCCAFIGVLG